MPGSVQNSQRIWAYLLQWGITLTAEWISTDLNVRADYESRHVRDSSEWKLSPRVFRNLCQKLGTPEIDLFASRTSHQLPRYMSWKEDPLCLAVDAFQQDWSEIFPYAFPPFCLIPRVLCQVENQQVRRMVAVQTLVPSPSFNGGDLSNFIATVDSYLDRSVGESTSTAHRFFSGSSGLAGIRSTLEKEGVSKEACKLIVDSRRTGTARNYGYAWKKWTEWCCLRKIDPFSSSIAAVLNFLAELFNKGLEQNGRETDKVRRRKKGWCYPEKPAMHERRWVGLQ